MIARREFLYLGTLGAAATLAPEASPRSARAQTRGGTLKVIYQEPTHLNMAIVSGTPTGIPGCQVFAGLVQFDEKFQARPYLAERWEVSPDGKTYTFHLVRSATFHDGHPITSEDVKFSIETVKQYHPFGVAMHRALEAVGTPDPGTVVFKLAHPYPAFQAAMAPLLLPVLPKHVYASGDIRSNPANVKPVGSGPFKFVEWQKGDHIILERYDRFFRQGRPYLDRIILQFVPDASARAAALETGAVDLIPYSYVSLADARRLEKLPNVTLTTKGYEAIGPLNWVEINLRRKELSDVRVRRALNHAIDKNLIVHDILLGFGKVADGPLVSESPYASPTLHRYPYDLDAANKLLDEAGLKRGADGTRFKLTIDFIPGAPELQTAVAEYMREQFKKVGVALQLRNSPDFPTWAGRMSGWDYDLSLDVVFNYPDPVIGVERTYISSNIKKVVWTNTMGYSNPSVDQLFAEAQVEQNTEKRKALYARVQDILTTDLPLIWINEVGYFTAYNRRVEGLPTDVWGTLGPYDGVWLKT